MNAESQIESNTIKYTAQKTRRNALKIGMFFLWFLPILAVVINFGFIASDRYGSTVGFSIRGIESSPMDGIGALTGLVSSGSTTADSYIVMKFLKSRSLVEELDLQLNISEMYSSNTIDYLSRVDPNASIEELTRYWESMIKTEFDPSSGIIGYTVQSFDPEFSLEISDLVLALTQGLVNDLSANARMDALRFAEEELSVQENRLRNALSAITEFRYTESSVDPTKSAALDIQLLSNLETRLIEINSSISIQEKELNSNAPSLISLKNQAIALDTQIKQRRDALTGQMLSNGSNISDQLSTFESLEVERRLAEQSYAASLNSLDQARRDASRNQRYLAVHQQATLAEIAEHPKRARNIFVGIFVITAIWIILVLFIYNLRDHLT